MSWKDERDLFEFGTPSHLGYLKMAEGDSRRDKRRCIHYDKKTGYCNRKRHNVNLSLRYCSGSSQCDRYAEIGDIRGAEQSQYATRNSLNAATESYQKEKINEALREKYITHIRKAIIEKRFGLQWECCAVAEQDIRIVKKTRGRTMQQITKSKHDALLEDVVMSMFRYREARFSQSMSRISGMKQYYCQTLSSFLRPYSCKADDIAVAEGLSIVDDEIDGIHEVSTSVFRPHTRTVATPQIVKARKNVATNEGTLPQKVNDHNEEDGYLREADEDIKKGYLESETQRGLVCRYRSIDTGSCNAPGCRNYKRVCGGVAGCPDYAKREKPPQKIIDAGGNRRTGNAPALKDEEPSAFDRWHEQMRRSGKTEAEIYVELCKIVFEFYRTEVEKQEKTFVEFERKYGTLLRKGSFTEATLIAEQSRQQLQEAAKSLQETREELRTFSRKINSTVNNTVGLDELRKKTRELLQNIPKK